MNWALKIPAKMVLSRLPVSRGLLNRLGVFRHGHMRQTAYALSVFNKHMNRVGGQRAFSGKVCLELGPGDSLANAIIAYAMGAKRTYLVDVGDFAERHASFYEQLIDLMEKEGFAVSELRGFSDVQNLLHKTGAIYLTDGLQSLKSVPSAEVDVIWSQAVLEHVRAAEVPAVLAELRRIITTNGIMSHRIDYKDHLDGKLNNLRFPSAIWELNWVANSGFYTNRIRISEFLRMFEMAGFELTSVERDRWEKVPIARSSLASEFRPLSDEDLITKGANVLAVPSKGSSDSSDKI